MSTEKQPVSINQDSAKQLPFKNRVFVKYIAPVMIPFSLGIVESTLNIGCSGASKKELQALETKMGTANTTQDNTIGTLNTTVQQIQTKLTAIEKTNTDQITIDSTQNANIDKINAEKKEEIAYLKNMIQILQDDAAVAKNTQDDSSSREGNTSREENSTDQNIDLTLEKSMLEFLETYRDALPLLSHFKTTLQVLNEAVKRQNIAKKVLEKGEADSYSHGTKKTTRVTIPHGRETFSFEEVLTKIDEIDPEKREDQLDNLINQQKEKIKQLEETQNSSEQNNDGTTRETGTTIMDENGEDDDEQDENTQQKQQPKPKADDINKEGEEPEENDDNEASYVLNDDGYDIPILARVRTGERLNGTYTINLQEGEFALAYGAYIKKSRSRKTYAMVCVSGPGAVTMHVASGVVDVFAQPDGENATAWTNHKKELIKDQIENQKRYYSSFPRNMTPDYVYKNNQFTPDSKSSINNQFIIEDQTGDNSQQR